MLPPITATRVFSAQNVQPPRPVNAAPQPYDADGRLSRAALEWIDAAALSPSTNQSWASRQVSAGLFAYLNFWDAEAADRHFDHLRTGVKIHQQYGPSLKNVIRQLDDQGLLLHVDVFLSPPGGDPALLDLLEHAGLKGALREGIVDQHLLGDGQALKERLQALPPGRCAMLSTGGNRLGADSCNVIAVLRDSEQLWVFDVTADAGVEGAMGGRYPKCVNGVAAESLLAEHLDSARRQPVLVSAPPPASGAHSTQEPHDRASLDR